MGKTETMQRVAQGVHMRLWRGGQWRAVSLVCYVYILYPRRRVGSEDVYTMYKAGLRGAETVGVLGGLRIKVRFGLRMCRGG